MIGNNFNTKDSSIVPDIHLRTLLCSITQGQNNPDCTLEISDLATIETLSAINLEIEELTGLEYCIALRHLELQVNSISDTSPIENLANIIYLDISSNSLSKIDLTTLTSMGALYLSNNYLDSLLVNHLSLLWELNVDNNILESLTRNVFANDT